MSADDEAQISEFMKRLPEWSAEQKLSGLRNDALGLILTLASLAALLETIDPASVTGLPKEFGEWTKQLRKTVHDLRETLDRYTVTGQ